jgi:hypothetical protein
MSVIVIKAVCAVALFYTLQANIPEVKTFQQDILPAIENPLQQDRQLELLEEKLNLIRLLQKYA